MSGSTIVLGTTYVGKDEPCFSLKEIIRRAPDSKSVRRYQIIRVLREGGPLFEYERDLGLASNFKTDELFIIGGGQDPATGRYWSEERVGDLMDLANHIRSGPYEPPPKPEPTNLIQQYHDLPDKRRRWRKAASQFGPWARIQRN